MSFLGHKCFLRIPAIGGYFLYPFSVSFGKYTHKKGLHPHIYVYMFICMCVSVCVYTEGDTYIPFLDVHNIIP